jgi:excisionase family DNA binding protein
MDRLLTTHDIAEMVQVDASTISKWIDRGILVAFRTPGGHRRVRAGDLVTFLRQHEMPVPEELAGSIVQLLAVDADKTSLDALKRVLKPHATTITLYTTTSGIEGVLLTSELRPHGVLVDLDLPDLDGLELCRAIRARPAFAAIRVVTMTSRHSKALHDKSLAAGAASCLPKPIELEDLLNLFRVPVALARKSA